MRIRSRENSPRHGATTTRKWMEPLVEYCKNLTTFRMLMLLLLAASAVFFAYEVSRSGPSSDGTGVSRQTFDAILETTDMFGNRLGTQEALAVATAVQFELLDDGHDSEQQIKLLLQRLLAASPAYVQGLGFSLTGEDGESHSLAYVSKTTAPASATRPPIAPARDRAEPLSAREINMERRISWRVLATPPASGSGRFASQLSVSMHCPLHPDDGEAIVIAGLDWLFDILKSLKEAGASHPLCVSPERDILWLDGDEMLCDKDFQLEGRASDGVVQRAKRFLAAGNAAGGREFVKTDIMGTGWLLLVPNSPPSRQAWESPLLPLAVFVVALFLLLSEAFFMPRQSAAAVGAMPAADGQAAGETRTGRAGLAKKTYVLLFKYRITNPDQSRLDSELKVARDIQFSLVPGSFPPYSEWREFDLHAVLHPAREVGGDYYDFFMPNPNRMVITVGDVSGKGVPAALYMAVSRTAFRALAVGAEDPGALLTSLNEMLVRDNHSGLYVTIVCFFVDLPTGKCEYAIAGHPAPLWYRCGEEKAEYLDQPRETFVGMKSGVEYLAGGIRLQSGDSLLLYSDGVSEARNPAGDELEYAGLQRLFLEGVGEQRCRNVVARLECALEAYSGGEEQSDDITLLAFRYWGPGGQKMPRKRQTPRLTQPDNPAPGDSGRS